MAFQQFSTVPHFAGPQQVNKRILQKRKWRKCRAVYLHHYAPAMSSPCWFRRKARSLAPLQTWTSIENVKRSLRMLKFESTASCSCTCPCRMDMTCKCCDSVSSNQNGCFCRATIPWTSWLRPARGTIKTIIKPWPGKAGQNYVLRYFAKHVWNWGGVTRPPTNSILQQEPEPPSLSSSWMRLCVQIDRQGMIN